MPEPVDAQGPELHVTATYPADGEGTECTEDGPTDCGVPLDAGIEIRFDRYLLPKTAVRQSIALYAGPNNNAFLLQPLYDVVERVVVFRLASGALLTPGLLYHVQIVSPGDAPNAFGFKAFDGAPLAKQNDVPLKFSFFTARAAPPPRVVEEPPTCFEVSSALERSGCSRADCHAGTHAPMGLRFDSRESLIDTAIGHVAHETDTGPSGGRPLVDPPRFGVDMPVIDPGNPGTSYLLYKLFIDPRNFGSVCDTKYRVSLSGACPAPSGPETGRLRDWFVELDPMPVGGTLAGYRETLDLLQRFILAGAPTDRCP